MLIIKDLVKKYPNNNFTSVDKISLTLKEGEIFGFLGKNGAGKSTTIKCLTGIIPYDSGNISICGHDISRDSIKAKMNMGYVPDNHMVIERLTGREYVNYVADLYKVDKMQRVERIRYFTSIFNLEAAVDKQIKSYSHGMKQKICIMAALIHEPKLWVLDEPMMGLDPQSTQDIINYMSEHASKGNTVFFSSHNLDLVKKLCDRVGIINAGRLEKIIDFKEHPVERDNLEEIFFGISKLLRKPV
ncbi:MAG: ABC transporter ATP-binding protein [Christensenellaceae bacterium]|jgi:ABC-2 type transport system ATP-binding protein|nr:ABC transporter ATP-binding protein [Christensenellaceae bacterium]